MYFIITKLSKVALTSTMSTCIHMSIHHVMGVKVRSMCMSWSVCMHRRNLFLSKYGFQTCVVHGTMAQVEPKQSTLFFNMHISFLILEDKVEYATEIFDDEVMVAWQT